MEVHYIYLGRQHNESHQTCLKEGGREGEWEYNGKGELVQATLYICMELS
jgi:hypothetical protein